MIIVIFSLIIFITGVLLLFYGNDNGDLLWFTLGTIMSSMGICGIIAFIAINLDVIVNWFKI